MRRGYEKVEEEKCHSEAVSCKPTSTSFDGDDQPAVMTTETTYCRICYEKTGHLIRPCRCAGSMRFVHRECLEKWIRHSKSLTCTICGVGMKRKKTFRRIPCNKANSCAFLTIFGWILFFIPLIFWFSCKIKKQLAHSRPKFVEWVATSSVFLVTATICACLALMVSLLVWRSCFVLYAACYVEEVTNFDDSTSGSPNNEEV